MFPMTVFRTSTRRQFLTTTTATLAAAAFTPRVTMAEVRSPLATPRDFLPDPLDRAHLHTLAAAAVNAARDAGASYADVRVAERFAVTIVRASGEIEFLAGDDVSDRVTARFEYGVRALVDGKWGFVYGAAPTTDALAAAARGAVQQARVSGQSPKHRVVLAPAPVATGTWTGPCAIDPFTVPFEEQLALLTGWATTGERVPGVARYGGHLEWIQETRVFASTDGTLTTQHVTRAQPFCSVVTNRERSSAQISLPILSVSPTCGGYETVTNPAILDDIVATSHEILRIALLNTIPVEVGRYPIVVDGNTLGSLCAHTLLPALEFDRVLGEEADASGTSMFTPAADFLGSHITPSLTVTTDRALPSVTAAKWDDEGVEVVPRTLIQDGRLVDYLTSRAYAPHLAEWYAKQGKPVKSGGCARAVQADWPVHVHGARVHVAPSTSNVTVDDLIRDVKRGIYVCNADYVMTDQQMSGGVLPGARFYEIRQGKLGQLVGGGSLQFTTRNLWKSLVAVGGSSTLLTTHGETTKGMPWRGVQHHSTAPAALFKGADMVQLTRSA
jgi:TldD protein